MQVDERDAYVLKLEREVVRLRQQNAALHAACASRAEIIGNQTEDGEYCSQCDSSWENYQYAKAFRDGEAFGRTLLSYVPSRGGRVIFINRPQPLSLAARRYLTKEVL